jgi:two-component system LytT family response regulator
MTWQAILVDDERLARAELRTLLGAHDGVEIVGEASTVAAAAEQVRLTGATLVFLDIMLKGESGFDLLPRLPEDLAVVFVTAYDRFAVQAFEVHALDYLLKPVSPARLAAALEHLGRRRGASETWRRRALPSHSPGRDGCSCGWTITWGSWRWRRSAPCSRTGIRPSS